MFSQLATLYLTPVFYTYMESLHAWFSRRVRRNQPAVIVPKQPVPVPVEN